MNGYATNLTPIFGRIPFNLNDTKILLGKVSDSKKNKCSVGPETSICPRGKGQGPTSFSERGLFFSEIWTASQGLTVV